MCYIDPPFFSNRNYAVIWGDKGEMRSFEDCWDGGIDTYINWIYKRVTEIHRVLKPTGSFYLHCDWHADAYLRVFVLDKIFGAKNFRNEVIWQRTNAHNHAKKKMPNLSDKIFYYSKSKTCMYSPTYAELVQLEREEGFKILPLTVEDILPVAKRPKVILKVECVKLSESGDYKFIATANTDDNRLIEFFAFKVLVKNKEGEFDIFTFDN